MKSGVAVIGDVMRDKYRYGTTSERTNPEHAEAPLIKMNASLEQYKLGGAANVAANIASLLNSDVMLFGAIGSDREGDAFIKKTQEHQIDFFPAYTTTAPTIIKERLIIDGKYQSRLDTEETIELREKQISKIIEELSKEKPGLIVISDYIKGMISEELVAKIKDFALHNNSKLLVDTKPKNVLLFSDSYLIKPNFKEFLEMSGLKDITNEDEHIELYGRQLAQKLNSNLLITRSEKGATLITLDGKVIHKPAISTNAIDVTGAGDTYIAAVTAKLKNGGSLEEGMTYANKASKVVVEKMGTAIITPEEIE